ncbi:MAG: hypothetical protein HY599_06490 [Candidatus Omnitrophica bacterium]|nr:hypothetical protein [Candidatus Omnitrophota bacterium]
MIILAHRGNLDGIAGARRENSPEAVRDALEAGFGVEIDVRAQGTRLYVSHDRRRWVRTRAFERYEPLLRRADGQSIGLDIKDPGAVAPLERRLRSLKLRRAFLFDFELAGARPTSVRRHAVRVSDLPAEDYRRRDLARWAYIWLDEMRREWVTAALVRDLRRRSRARILWVSPELHGRPHTRRWRAARRWPIDGICTDYPLEFQRWWTDR